MEIKGENPNAISFRRERIMAYLANFGISKVTLGQVRQILEMREKQI
jgi:hypothetical protein